MTKDVQHSTETIFEQITQADKNVNEYWSARQMAKVLDQAEFRNFLPVIERAKEACTKSGQEAKNNLWRSTKW